MCGIVLRETMWLPFIFPHIHGRIHGGTSPQRMKSPTTCVGILPSRKELILSFRLALGRGASLYKMYISPQFCGLSVRCVQHSRESRQEHIQV